MNNEAFLALVRAGLWEECVSVSGERLAVSGKDVLRLAEEQSVVGLVAAGAEWFTVHGSRFMIPLTEKLTMLGMCLLIEHRNEAMNRFIAELVKRMREADIKVVLVKGQGVAQCYAKPQWRAAGDIDLMLDEENYRKAKALLTPLATHVETEDMPRMHLGMTFEPWTVELHGTMHTGVSKRINAVIDEVQREVCSQGSVRSWNNGGVEVLLPSPGNDALLVFTHFINHFYGSGIGLRQVCDWCRLLWTYRGQMDVEMLHARLQAMGLLSEWKAFAAFAVEHLGMPAEVMPLYEKRRRHSRQGARLCRLVLETGNLGHNKDQSYRAKYPKRGSGLKRICNATKGLEGYKEELCPVFKSTASHFMTTIYAVKERQTDVIYDVTYGDRCDLMAQLSERQRAIVSFVKLNPKVTAAEMARMLHVSERTIRRDISEMGHILHHEGDRNDGVWVLVETK